MTMSQLAILTNLYREGHRNYHDLTHIAQMFDMARVMKAKLSEVQTLAIWYHDAIYQPGRSDNESRSAYLAKEHLNGVLEEKDLNLLETIIMDTKDHIPSTPESSLVLDLDMSILGANPDSYKIYMKLIRKEYASVPYNKYVMGRSMVLEDFLAKAKRGALYFELGEVLNDHAISNINIELELLKNHNDLLIH